jgi:hypothetical protein
MPEPEPCTNRSSSLLLLDLPREIRDQIYRYALETSILFETRTSRITAKTGAIRNSAIRRVNWQIRRETETVDTETPGTAEIMWYYSGEPANSRKAVCHLMRATARALSGTAAQAVVDIISSLIEALHHLGLEPRDYELWHPLLVQWYAFVQDCESRKKVDWIQRSGCSDLQNVYTMFCAPAGPLLLARKHPASGSSKWKSWLRMLVADGLCNLEFILHLEEKGLLHGCRST